MKRLLLGIFAVWLLAGCSTKLDTGYEPNKLGSMTPDQRRAMYAPQFTEESQGGAPQESSQFHHASQGY